MGIPSNVKIYEVGPRDGLQNEIEFVGTDIKVELIDRLSESGLKYIEATSFVSSKAIPALADHNNVMNNIHRKDGVTYPVLVPNKKGLDAALEHGIDEIAVFAAASESFSKANINATIDESLERFVPVIQKAKDRNIKIRGYVSCVLGCPYEGFIAPVKVADVAQKLYEMGCYEISLGDTIGVGTPNTTIEMLEAVIKTIPTENIALHMHDTYGQALVNIYAGLQMEVSVIDSSVGGLGGCPYAPGASGNVATEDVLYMLHGMGIETGVDLNQIIDAAWFITKALNREPSSKLAMIKQEKYQ